ncbi:MAG TPA: FtsW/RodA/SpoVE family cell cycle protein [Tepidisphaeraceae bacterium]|jgi:rod shape determining protein RodA|nr:FtsW/RodA/SpoVE family cell cycle protein [Tepidisphaeraceae bacterium]
MRKLWEQLAIATNWPVLAAVLILSAVGILSIWATDSTDGIKHDGVKQLVFLGVSLVCMGLFQVVNYQEIGRWAWPFYTLSLLLILYTLAAKVARLPFVHETKGAYAWLSFGSVSLEPAELMKLAFVLVLARYLRFRSNYRTMRGLLAPFAVALLPVAMILKQPDLGMASLYIPTLFVMLFVAGARIKHLLLVALMGIAVVPLLWFSGPKPDGPGLPVLKHGPLFVQAYQRQRVFAMFKHDPRTMRESAYQTHRAMTAFASGGVTGNGAGVIPVGKNVPEAHNDMIFALVGEQFGLVGAAVVLGAFLVLFAAGIEIAAATREPFGRLIAVGIVSMLAAQAFVNLAVMLRLMPVTGITLPFVSYGGSSLVSNFMAVGLLLNIGQNRPLVMARDAFEFGE